ncbi:MAG: DDE-type integrase/transposase/recombinase [Candidatus Omnitrophica bacterium]|nr:DDE-type integrase/transposase/recombinase [Candidatus Omnitrophota bacterium]
MDAEQRMDLVRKVELQQGRRDEVLRALGIARSTYYKWRKAYYEGGLDALKKAGTRARRIWNRLSAQEVEKVIEIARHHPELSCRLIALKITDLEDFTVSESTVYRILKERGLIAPRPLPQMLAEKEFRQKTARPDEMWQCDATNLFVVDWGYYKLIPVEDDYSRKIIAYDLKPDESAFSISDVIEMGVEKARQEGHLLDPNNMPRLFTDNGSGFTSSIMAKYLACHGIRHIFSTPYHPQSRGKIERFNRSIKEMICLVVYLSPEQLKRAIDEAIRVYNQTPHEALKNVSPNDVYAGRKEVILQKRLEKKRLTLERRKRYNLIINYDQNQSLCLH